MLYAALPGGRIGRGTLRQWREQLLDQGYSPSTVNTSVSAANSFLEWLGCREFQLTGRLSCGRDAQLELTRSEYLRLLSTPGRSRTPSPAASTVTCSSSWTGNPVEVNSLISR